MRRIGLSRKLGIRRVQLLDVLSRCVLPPLYRRRETDGDGGYSRSRIKNWHRANGKRSAGIPPTLNLSEEGEEG